MRAHSLNAALEVTRLEFGAPVNTDHTCSRLSNREGAKLNGNRARDFHNPQLPKENVDISNGFVEVVKRSLAQRKSDKTWILSQIDSRYSTRR